MEPRESRTESAMTHTFFELFAGAGGMSLGLETAGWQCAGHAEIEKFPRAILAHRWPDTPLLGDVTQLTGEQIGPVTLLSGGSPCQDLSIAGKRAGMTDGSGTRSSLFFEQMRLWHESQAPYCLWENVLGAFSSNHGRDFAAVLSAFVGTDLLADGAIHPDRTGKFRWKSAGVASGPTGVAAWRVLDAQYFGVPQRRRRVFVLGTRIGGVDPAEVLALSESVRGDSQTRRTTRQGTPDATPRRTYAIRGTIAAGLGAASGGPNGTGVTDNACWTLNTTEQHAVMAIPIDTRNATRTTEPDAQNRQGLGVGKDGDPSPTLTNVFVPAVVTFDNRPRINASGVHDTLTTEGLRNPPSVLVVDKQSGLASAGVAPTLKTDLSHQMGPVVAVSNNKGGAALTPWDCQSKRIFAAEGIFPPLQASEKSGQQQPAIFTKQQYGRYQDAPSVASTLGARDHASQNTDVVVTNAMNGLKAWSAQTAADGFITPSAGRPRRLTPLECERLMGWPDNHTLVPSASDSGRYKACGNGIASPVAAWIGLRLREALAHHSSTPEALA